MSAVEQQECHLTEGAVEGCGVCPDCLEWEKGNVVSLKDRLAKHKVQPLRQAEPAGPFLTCGADLAGKAVPERKWLVEGVIPGRQVTLLYGDGGLGKSLLAMQLAVAVAGGKRWVSLPVENGTAIYLGAEDEADEMHIRLNEICHNLGIGLDSLTNFHFRSLVGEDAMMATLPGPHAKLTASSLYSRVEDEIIKHKPAVIILDTLADMFPGEEINRRHVREFVNILKKLAVKYDCAVVMLAHPSKSGMASGRGDSGSTAWNGSARARLYMTAHEGEDADPNERLLTVMKNNYGKSGEQFKLRYDDGAFVLQQGVNSVDKAAMLGKAKRVFLALLRQRNEQGRDVTDQNAAKTFSEDSDSEGITKLKFREAKEALLKEGKVVVEKNKRGSNCLRIVE